MSKLTPTERADIIDKCQPPASFMNAVNKAFAGDISDLSEILGAINDGYEKAMGNVSGIEVLTVSSASK